MQRNLPILDQCKFPLRLIRFSYDGIKKVTEFDFKILHSISLSEYVLFLNKQ